METKFTEQDSLKVINSMIAQARGGVEKGDGKYFLLWGYIVVLASIAHFVLIRFYQFDTNTAYSGTCFHPGHIWLIAFAVGMVGTLFLIRSDRKKTRVKTYTGQIGTAIWISFGICAALSSFLFVGKSSMIIYPVIALIYIFALMVSAATYRFRWMWWNAGICVLLVLIFKFLPVFYWSLLYAALMVVGNVIPGHIINLKASRNVQRS